MPSEAHKLSFLLPSKRCTGCWVSLLGWRSLVPLALSLMLTFRVCPTFYTRRYWA